MYIVEIINQWRRRKRTAVAAGDWRLPRTVYALGGTSLLTDVSTEMVASVLPVYLLVALRLSPSEYGLVDGMFRGGAAVAAILLGGVLSTGSGREKWIAGIGYGFSAIAKIALLMSGAFAAIASSLILDRSGKGLRVAPRDAMLAASVQPAQLGLAFGVHRAMDGIGAVAGPLLAAFVLWRMPNGYATVFTISLIAATAGVLVFFCFVKSPAALPKIPSDQMVSAGWRRRLHDCLPASSRRLLWFAMLLTFFTISEGMIYAHMQRSFALDPYMQPLLPVATATVFLLLAAPIGQLADRIGALQVFAGAHLLLLPLYTLFALTEDGSLWQAAALVGLLGCFFAATDGVLMAAVAGVVPVRSRAMSLAFFAAGLSVMKMASSAVFGLLWDRIDIPGAVLIYGAGLFFSLMAFLWANPFRSLAQAKLEPEADSAAP